MTGADRDADVAIVGFGPVGSTLAILLAQAGRSVTVLERWPEPYLLPRAVHMDHEVARVFQACGLGPDLVGISEPADLYEWRNSAGQTLLRIGREGVGACGWPSSLMFNQPDLERLLHKRAATAGVDIRLGEQVTGLSQDDRRVTLETATGSRVTANYVVGCDGANSTVRRLAQLEFTDLGFFYDWLIVDVILDQPRRYDPINLQVCDPLRPTTLVSGGPGRRRWEFMCLPGESLDDLNSPERAWELLQVWDIDPDNARLERHAVYTFNARFAEQWRNGRILIAGDAAHQMPPFAGQGMCAGIRDAGNLAWKLDLVLTGRSPETLLDHYGPERRPEVRATIDFSMELGKVICVADPTEAASRDEAMSALVGPEPTEVPPLPAIEHGVIDQSSPHAGHLFPQGPVGDRLFDDVYGVGWTMLTTDSFGPVEPDVAEWFASIGGQIVTVPTDTPVYDRWFAEHDCRAALQRPDFHLFGTACDPGGIASLISRLRSLLSPIDPAQGAPS